MTDGIQPVMNVGGGYDGMGGCGSAFWIFALLILGMNGGLWGNGGNGRCATVEDINNSANFTRLENQVQGIGSGMTQGFTNIYNGICDLGYKTQADFAALGSKIDDCCCQSLRANDQTRFDLANYTAAINANTTAGIQKVLDKLCQDKTEALQAKVGQLELQQALCGVVRYPNSFAYAVGTPFNVGCGCNGNI